MKLLNKIILVTGASSGIGRASCIRLIQEGAFVIATGRNTAKIESLKEEVSHPDKLAIEEKDVNENTSNLNRWVFDISKKYGKLNGIVLSAGILHIAPLRSMTEGQLHKVFQTNFDSNYWLAKGFCDKRVNAGAGSSLVFISSISSIKGEGGLTAYSASKGALNSFMKSLAKEVSGNGIRVNSILPGMVRTELLDKWQDIYTDKYMEEEVKAYPLGIGKPDDVSGPIAFLLSKDSEWITGVCLPVDGGYTL